MTASTRIIILFLTMFLLVGACASPTASSRLSRDEAIRLADAEAIRKMHIDLRYYEHRPVSYDTKEGRWYIGYGRKGNKFADFGVDVYEKTKKAWVIVPY